MVRGEDLRAAAHRIFGPPPGQTRPKIPGPSIAGVKGRRRLQRDQQWQE